MENSVDQVVIGGSARPAPDLKHLPPAWREAIKAVRNPIFIHDRQFRIVTANPAYAEAAGRTLRDLRGRLYWECFPRGEGPLPSCKRAIRTGRVVEDEVHGPDGAVYLSRSFPVQKGRRGRYFVHIFEDVTADRRKEEALAETEERLGEKEEVLAETEHRLDRVIRTTSDGILVLNGQGKILFSNPGAARLMGRPETDLTGFHFGIPGRPTTEFEVAHPDHSLKLVEMQSAETEWGGERAYAVNLHDVTEHRLLEEERLRSSERYRTLLMQTIKAIANTIEKRDPYTAGHQSRVASLARAMAHKLGLSADQAEGIYMGGVLHDIGKIAVPAEILTRPTALSQEEFAFIKTHPQVGREIVGGITFPWPVSDMVYQHHERLDGSGYPQGLAGEAICQEARILAVADTVEAISSHRPYRPALGLEAALDTIRHGRGTQLCPQAVDACTRLFETQEFSFDTPGR